MPRRLTLRQVEAFKAVIETGSISTAAELVHISQPAMSKLIAHFESDTGLKLFDRLKGRLAPTEQAMRLHEEIARIFAGVRQVENAAEAIRREEQGRLTIGAVPALAGSFVQRATMAFLKQRGNVFCSVQPLSSQWIVDRLVTRDFDVGLVTGRIDNPYVIFEPLMEHPLVCIMPLDHPLAEKNVIRPSDLEQTPFISFNLDSHAADQIAAMFTASGVNAKIALIAAGTPTICEFVAAGLGVSLVHPLMASGMEGRLSVRPFEPKVLFKFQIARSADSRNSRLVEAFAEQVRDTAAQISRAMLSGT